jgi:hypothetical protein
MHAAPCGLNECSGTDGSARRWLREVLATKLEVNPILLDDHRPRVVRHEYELTFCSARRSGPIRSSLRSEWSAETHRQAATCRLTIGQAETDHLDREGEGLAEYDLLSVSDSREDYVRPSGFSAARNTRL